MHLNLFLWLHHIGHSSSFIEMIVIWFARYAQYVVILLVVAFLLIEFSRHKRVIEEGVVVAATALAGWTASAMIKIIVQAPRPFLALETVDPLFMYGGHNSFPSGHATTFFALAMAMYFYSKPLGIIFFIGAFLISIARVMAGIHFPTDILVGAVIGILVGYLVHRYFVKLFRSRK